MTRRRIWMAVVLLCWMFIISGAFNIGISQFYMAVPFMLASLRICIYIIKIKWLTKITLILILCSVLVNITLERNPIVFPILVNGSIRINADAYYETFSDGSGGLVKNKDDTSGYDDVVYKSVKAGSVYAVSGVKKSPSGFSNTISLLTELGEIPESNYDESHLYGEYIAVANKDVHSLWAQRISFLMVWPLLFMVYFPIGIILFLVVALYCIHRMKHLPES